MSESELSERNAFRLSLASLGCLLLGLAVLALFHTGSYSPGSFVPADFLGIILLTAACLVGIAALIATSRSGPSLHAVGPAILAVLMSSIVIRLTIAPGLAYAGGIQFPYQMLCGTNMKGISNALLAYGQHHDDQLPEAAKWCDLLITKADISSASFICKASEAVKGESSYALNVAAAGKKFVELPSDMVLLFEVRPDDNAARTFPLASRAFAKDPNCTDRTTDTSSLVCESRWNQVCGPERLDISSHESGCNILFANMSVEFVKTDRLPYLRWNIDGKADFPVNLPVYTEPEYRLPYGSLAVVALIAAAATLLVLWRYGALRSWKLCLLMAILAPFPGRLFGLWGQMLHRLPPLHGQPGGIAGLVVGILAGLAYASFVSKTSASLSRYRDRLLYAVGVGMATGVISSSIVHLVLALICQKMQGGLPFVVGMPYGIAAGMALGVIASCFLRPALAASTSSQKEATK